MSIKTPLRDFFLFASVILQLSGARAVICAELFPPLSKPFFFVVEIEKMKSFILGTTDSAYSLSHYPPYVLEALEASRFLVIDDESSHRLQSFSFLEGATSAQPLHQLLSNSALMVYHDQTRILSQLNARLAACQTGRTLTAKEIDEFHNEMFQQYFNRLTPDTASDLAQPSAEIQALARMRNSELLEAASVFLQATADPDRTLTRQLMNLAKDRGIVTEALDLPEVSENFKRDRESIAYLEQLLQCLAQQRQSSLSPPRYDKGSLKDLTAYALFIRHHNPKRFKHTVSNRVWRWMPHVLSLHFHSAPVFFAVDVHTLSTKDGLLHLLASEGFRVSQITSQKKWQARRPRPAKQKLR